MLLTNHLHRLKRHKAIHKASPKYQRSHILHSEKASQRFAYPSKLYLLGCVPHHPEQTGIATAMCQCQRWRCKVTNSTMHAQLHNICSSLSLSTHWRELWRFLFIRAGQSLTCLQYSRSRDAALVSRGYIYKRHPWFFVLYWSDERWKCSAMWVKWNSSPEEFCINVTLIQVITLSVSRAVEKRFQAAVE